MDEADYVGNVTGGNDDNACSSVTSGMWSDDDTWDEFSDGNVVQSQNIGHLSMGGMSTTRKNQLEILPGLL